MAEQLIDDPMFDYKLYRFGRSRQVFRGPQPDLRGKYVSFLGGSSTFGRYVDVPYSQIIGQELSITALNLGSEGAGPGFFLSDPEVLRTASSSTVCVVHAMCATALSNRMFSVRPRRNRRIHAVSDLLIGIYPEVDFHRFSFVNALLRHLEAIDDNRFKLVMNEMKNAWIGRTQTLLSSLECKTVLLWFSQRAPEDPEHDPEDPANYPHCVDRAMIDAVKGAADGYVECVTSVGLPQDLTVDGNAVLFKPSGEPINHNNSFPSPHMHQAAAELLIPEIRRVLG
ncbi:MAG: DUF6473 family protein [Pseudomonadota bacterium]